MASYSGAIAHYRNLKNAMISRLINNAEIGTLTKEKLANAIVQNNNSISSSDLRSARTNEILHAFENALFENESQYAELIAQCQRAENEKNAEALAQAKVALKELLALNQNTVVQQAMSGELIQGINAADYNTVYGQMKSILVNSLISGKHLTLYQNSAIRIGGFVQEVMELQALRDFFSRPGVKQTMANVYLTGSETITLGTGQKVDSPMDLVISTLQDTETAFNTAVTTSENIDKYLDGTLSYSNLTSFGIQSKSWNITSSLRFYEIGHRTNLLNSYKSASPRSFYKVEKAIEFLSQTKNTLEALGPKNVLFRTGSQRFWMDEFLQEITKTMSLIFASSENKYYNPSPVVGFSQIYINYKNTKNIQRQQYSYK